VKSKAIWIGITLSFAMGLAHYNLAQSYDIKVTPRNYNFGKVKLGSEKSKSISVSSISGAFVIVNYTFSPNSSPDFRISSTPLSDAVSRGMNAYFEITFKPTSPGLHVAALSISLRQGMEVFHVPVNFKGFGEGPTPRDRITEIQTFVDKAIQEGTLAGVGEGATAQRCLKEFKEQIRIAIMFLKNGIKEEACRLFLDAIRKMDGKSSAENAPDFVQGEATRELSRMIRDLRHTLKCD
jgi:hypothetical protein